ncbi:hypothetical protein [Pseudovibrio sp. POLY-S9]|uniref:hypothetical protein n=1 Tax=Pseudovibrio sp. POLY-S9 TaxID=1576596 RepID=UPI000AB94F94|nr:hypothetical protein [Pseudovibrio sp. POLY-S9]
MPLQSKVKAAKVGNFQAAQMGKIHPALTLQFLLENYGCRHELKVHRINQPALKFYSALGYEDITAQADAHQTWQRLRSPEAILDHSPAIAVGEQVSHRQ